MTARGFLDLPDGMAIHIGSAGLLLGRHIGCDIQLIAETASRRHALLRMNGATIELFVLGRHAVEVDGREVTTMAVLGNGARLAFPGLACRVRIERVEATVPIAHALCRGSERFPIRTSPFVIGGGDANVVIDGWPTDALRLAVVQGELIAELGEPGLVNGIELAAGAPIAVTDGDTLELRGQKFQIEHAGDDNASTVAPTSRVALRGAVLEPLPRGGRITFAFADGDRTVYLPGRRYRLVAALLRPPAPFAAGDLIPDQDLIPLVWDDTDEVGGRVEINVVLVRARQDLVAAGIAATKLLERGPGGRATRIAIDPAAVVRVID